MDFHPLRPEQRRIHHQAGSIECHGGSPRINGNPCQSIGKSAMPAFVSQNDAYITKVFSGRVSGLPQTEIFCGLVKNFFSGLRVSEILPLSALFFA